MALALNESEHHQKRHYMCLTGSEVPQTKSVKRLRRDEHVSVVGDTLPVQQQECFSTSVTKIVKRSSKFRGVSRHKWTGRYEAHLWDKLTWNVTQKKKGKQVYLGAYDDEEAAARAYDLASLKYWGSSTFTNFPISNYEKELEVMQITTKEEYLASLRIKSSGLSRGALMYRGVTRHHQNRRQEAERGSVFGNKYLHLGTYSKQEKAAQAYDIAAIKYAGINAITNFDLSTYMRWFKPGTKNLVSVRETKLSTESKEESSYNCSGIKMQSSCLTAKPGRMNSISVQEKYTRNTLFSSCRKSSSPTALGLLLRSSVFRELVKKNSNLSEEESDDENTKNLLQASSNDRCENLESKYSMRKTNGLQMIEQHNRHLYSVHLDSESVG